MKPAATICLLAVLLASGLLALAATAGRGDPAPPAAAARSPAWWAFRPLREVPLPAVKEPHASASPVDRFLRAAPGKKALRTAPPADPRTLFRRLSFDLVGLPPAPAEVEDFLRQQGTSPDAYPRLVDRLLASPHFGERWARHWLDVARYADSDGQESDADRPTAYHYRDFVIRAFNEDLPYDTFVRWQLAGDEYEPDNPLAVAATGFVAAGPYTVLDVPMEEEKIRSRLNELDDMVSTTGQAFLGLTVGCARCHDHKYDPIPTRDYYRLQAAFNSGDRTQVPLVPRAEAARRKAAESAWKQRLEAAQKSLDGWLAEQKEPLTPQLRAARIERLPIDAAQKALLKDSPDDPPAKELARRFARELRIEDGDYRDLFSDAQRAKWEALTAAVKQLEGEKPPAMPTAFAMADFGANPRQTWLLDRGDLYLKKEPVELGFLTALTPDTPAAEYWRRAKAAGSRDDTTYQRRALADWITDPRHGAGALLARVIVNRLWQHHFGDGLVRTVNDFGARGEPPSHPELLEWLASELVRGGWELKPIHRLIVTSAAYRQARSRPRRIEAEGFRDAMLAVSGTLDPAVGGPPFKAPIQAEAIQARNVTDPYPPDLRDTPATHRRSVYMFHKRVVQHPLLQAFDGPDAAVSCGRRAVTTVAPQALAVMNEPFVRLRAGDFARRLLVETGDQPTAQVEYAYRLALSRAPSPAERDASVRFVEQQTARRAARDGADARRLALTDFAQVLFGLNEFIYVD